MNDYLPSMIVDPTAADLRAERDDIHRRIFGILDAAQRAGAKELTKSQQADYDGLQKRYDEINTKLSKIVERDPIVNGGNPASARTGWTATEEGQAFLHYVRTGDVTPELRALGKGTGSAGGYSVPTGFRSGITERKKMYDAVRRVAQVITTDDGRDLPWATNDDVSNVGGILAENVQASETDITLGTKTLGAYKFSSDIIRFSVELFQDSDLDLVNFLERKQAERVGRKQSTLFTTGTGTAQPLGIVTGAATGVTAAGATAITADELLDLVHSVDPAYRQPSGGDFVGFMMADATLAKIRKLKTSGSGDYVFQADASAGFAGSLFGYPVQINNDCPAATTGSKAVLFGNLTQGYVIRDVRDAFQVVFDERYADFGQMAVLLLERADATVQDVYAYKSLVMA